MVLAALLAIAFASPIEDYYPLTPATKWTYEGDSGLQSVNESGNPIDIGKGVMATPMKSTSSGRDGGYLLYRIEGDTLLLVGHNNSNPKKTEPDLLKEPQPILRIGAAKLDWQYVGEIVTGMGPVLIQMHGDSNKGPKRKVFDREVDTIVAHIVSKIGNDQQGVEVRQDVTYGKGIGMIEMDEATKAQGKTVKRVLKLVKFEPPQG